jgi:pimeloyl-ACP methyl ester carboxylesterase
MVGHSNGGDISMYFAKRYPEMIKKVVTLDKLRVPFTGLHRQPVSPDGHRSVAGRPTRWPSS